jgi:tape measure domain-containing protein
MADSVARVRILAQIEGLEGFDKLKGAFKGLQQAIGPTDQQLAKARQDIIAFGEAGKRTEQIIRGQIDALRALKSQAGTGGQLYTTLGADIRRLEGEVRGLSAAYVDLATNKAYTEAQLRNLSPATSKPGMLSAQVDLMQADLARMKLLTREYIAKIAEINQATTQGQRKQTTTSLFGAALSNNQYLNNTNFFDAPAAFEKQANAGVLPRTVAAKQAEISQIKEQLQNVLRDAGNLEPLLNDIRRIEGRLATQATSGGGTRTTIGGLEGAGRDLGTDWQKARITLGQLTTEYERLKRAQQDQVRVLETQLLEAEKDLQRMLNGTTKESEQLTRAEERRARVAEKLAQIQQDASRAPGVGGYRDPETGAMLARGNESTRQARQNLLAQIQMPVREISSLYQSIGSVGISKIANDVERMGNSYQEVAKDIRAAKAASDGSVSSLQSQRAAWEALRNSVNANGREFREATRELAALDKQLERTQPGGLRGKVGYIAQGVGAIASAGIFGGPEGAIGGALGGAIGALGGAPGFAAGSFIGSSVGAYAGMARQQAGVIAGYVKELNLAKVTLAQASSGQEEYNRQLQLARQISKDYSVGLVDTIKGYSQVATAAKANGLNLKETEDIYRGAVAAGVAFGRSQEDISAIITATVQVLSKGKLSAEELQGQIGERLPGAVAKFAAATGRSLPQLAKDLEQGKVSIADFVKFSQKQVQDYDEIAKIIGASPEKAGERLKLALDTAAENYGGFFQQIGSGFQDNITRIISWLNENQDSIKQWVTAWVNAGIDIVNVLKKIGEILGPIVTGFADLVKRTYEFMQYNPGVFLGGKLREGLRGIFGVEQSKLTPDQLFPKFKPPANAFGTGTLTAPGKTDLETSTAKEEADKAAREAARLAAEQQRLEEQLARNAIELDNKRFQNRRDLIQREFEFQQELANRANSLWANSFLGKGAQSARALTELFSKLSGYQGVLQQSSGRIASAQQELSSAQRFEGVTSQGLPASGTGKDPVATHKLGSQAQALVKAAQKLGVSPLDLATIIGFETGGTYSPSKWGGAGGNYMGLIQFGPNERKQYGAYQGQSFEEQVLGPVVKYFQDRFKNVGMSTRGADLLTLYRTVLGGNPKASLTGRDAFGTSPQSGVSMMAPHRSAALNRFFGGNVANVPSGGAGMASQIRRDASAEGRVDLAKEELAIAKKISEFEEQRIAKLKEFDYAEFSQSITQSLREQNDALANNLDEILLKNQLEASGMRPELVQAEMDKARAYRDQAELLEPLKEALKVVDDPEQKTLIQEAIESINSGYEDQLILINSIAQAQTAQGVALANYVGQLKQQLDQLTNIENVLISVSQVVETEISTAMSSAVTAVVTGSGSIKQSLSQMFASIGQSFVKMATDIIAKQLVMITLQSILKALGGGLFGGGGGGVPGLPGLSGAGALRPGRPAFGGVFANGGVMTSRGPIPLKKYARGGVANSPQMALFGEGSKPEAYVPLPDGRSIPVSLKGQDKMNEIMGRSPVAQQAPTLNMTFQTTNIGGVEYVSRDQLEAAMAETRRAASRDGAKRGMSMTLDRLQQSPSTRRQVGLR